MTPPQRNRSPGQNKRTDTAVLTEACPACSTKVTVIDLEPLSLVRCPNCGTEFVASEYLNEFRLISIVGRGTLGVVYQAVDTSSNRPVALKVFRRDHISGSAILQLEAEIGVAAAIQNSHVVKVYSTGNAGDRYFIAMEFVERGTLDEMIRVRGTVPESQALEIAIQAAEGLSAAWQRGLTHRDVKPGNILFSHTSEAKVADFALAVLEEEAASQKGEIWGSPYYAAPERMRRLPEDIRSDIFSLGATLFHAIAGRPPSDAQPALQAGDGPGVEAINLQAFAPWASSSTAYVVNRMLLSEPEARYQNYDELLEHLRYASNELNPRAVAVKPKAGLGGVPAQPVPNRRKYMIAAIMVGCALLGAVLFFARKTGSLSGASTAGGASSAAYDSRLAGARQLLASGMNGDAAGNFHGLAADISAPLEVRQWSATLEGLSRLVAGQLPQAKTAFRSLAELAPTGAAKSGNLQAFFAQVGSTAGSDAPVPAELLRGIDQSGPGSLALLIFGLKDWELGRFDESVQFLREFQSATPHGDDAWIADLHPIAADYAADYAEYEGVAIRLKNAGTPEDAAAAVEKARKFRSTMRRRGKLTAQVDSLLAERANTTAPVVSPPPAPAPVAATPPQPGNFQLPGASSGSAESASVRPRIAELCRAARFDEAVAEAGKINISSAHERRERYALLAKIEWLRAFKTAMLSEVAAVGTSVPIKRKDGAAVSSEVSGATDEAISFKSGVTLQWSDVSPESILAISKESLHSIENRNDIADREWLTGVYALSVGKGAEAATHLLAAARLQTGYYDLLPLLSILPKMDNLAKGRPVAAGNSRDKQEGPEKAVDGLLETKWASMGYPEAAWLRIDLGAERPIHRWVVRYAKSRKDGADSGAATFVLQKSSDNKTWKDVDTQEGDVPDVLSRQPPPFSARYLRLRIAKGEQSPDLTTGVVEWEIYGPPDLATAKMPVSLFSAYAGAATPSLTMIDMDPTEETPGVTTIEKLVGSFRLSSRGMAQTARDHGRFAGRAGTGDGSVSACVASVEGADAGGAMAGVQFEDSLNAGSRRVFAGITNAGKAVLNYRDTTGGAIQEMILSNSVPIPCWVKLERTGIDYRASLSADGVIWKEAGRLTAPMNSTAYGGIAAVTLQMHRDAAATFDCIDLRMDAGATGSSDAQLVPAGKTSAGRTGAASNAPALGTGLHAEYFGNLMLTPPVAFNRVDPTIDFIWPGSPGGSLPADGWSARWTGQVQPQYSETYTFYTFCDDGARLWVNGVLVVSDWNAHYPKEYSGVIALVGGQKYDLKMEYYDDIWDGQAQLWWSSPSTPKALVPQNRLYPENDPGAGK